MNSRKLLAASLTTILCALMVFGTGAPAVAEESPLSQLVGTPGGDAQGSNDWDCQPSHAHPEPIVLTHGTSQNRQNDWKTLAPVLAQEGYCVFALTYGNYPDLPWPLNAVGGLLPMEDSAQQLSGFVDRVLDATGASRIDLIGHSQGSIMPTYYVKFLGGNSKVDDYISLAAMWQGSHRPPFMQAAQMLDKIGVYGRLGSALNGLGCGVCTQLLAGSDWFDMIAASGVYADDVTYINILTRYDDVVIPYTSGYRAAPNATNIVLQDACPLDLVEHADIVDDPIAITWVLNALDPAHPRPVPCLPVPPEID